MVSIHENVSLKPRIVRADEGIVGGLGPEVARVVLSSAQTGGAFMLAEVRIDAPAYGPPYHVHTREDETFTCLEGELVVVIDGVRHVLRPGDTAFAARGVPHRFESGPDGVRFYAMVTGGNFERFFPRYAEAIQAGETERLPDIAAEHGIAFIAEA